MRKIAEYEEHAQICRNMAARASRPEHKQQLVEIARGLGNARARETKKLVRRLEKHRADVQHEPTGL